MYKTLAKRDFLKKLRIDDSETPDGILLYGTWRMKFNQELVKSFLKDVRQVDEHIVLGKFRGKNIMFAVTYGAPFTSECVHIGALLGAKVVVHTGSFGGLQKGMKVGDVFLPTTAFRGEGASDWYLEEEEAADASPEVVSWIKKSFKSTKTTEGKIYTTSAMLGETWEDVIRWNKDGYTGVDLEVATVYAVAKHFKIQRAAILYLVDNLIEKHNVLMLTDEDKNNILPIKELILKRGLEAISHFCK